MGIDIIEVVSLANRLSTAAGLGVRVSSLRQCNAHFFSRMFASLTGTQLTPLPTESSRCQAVVDALSNHLSPHVSLEHIKGEDLANQDRVSIKNLLDIFSVLFGLPPPMSYHSNSHMGEGGDLANDSNLISSEGLSVISEVLQEELGSGSAHVTRPPCTQSHSSHSTTDMDTTAELLRPVPRVTLPPFVTTPVSMATSTSDHPTSSTASQTTPTQSPDRRRRLLQSPLHHSTPHVSTRSRVFYSPTSHTPHVLIYPHTPHQPHTLTDVSSTVLPNSTHSTVAPDLTITELHTITPSPEREPRPHKVRFTEESITEQSPAERQSGQSVSGLTAHHPSTPTPPSPTTHTQDPSSATPPSQLTQSHSPSTPTPLSPTPPPTRSSPARVSQPPQGHPPSTQSQESDSDEASSDEAFSDEAGRLDRSRDDVLATLYRNYISEQRRKGKGVGNRRSKVKGGGNKSTTASSKGKRAKTHLCSSRQKRAVTPPPSSESSEEEQTPETPTEFAIGDDLLPLVGREFPFLHMSPSMMRVMWQKQVAQIQALTKSGVGQSGQGLCRKVREMERRHEALLALIKKEVLHTQRMQRTQEQRSQKQAVLSRVRTKRQSAARARRYFHDYELRLRAKLQRQRTREEQIFRRAFEGGLALQRERVREVRTLTREREEATARDHQDRLEAMENFYRDQFTMLTESMVTERDNAALREKAQNKVVRGLRHELRKKMEQEIRELQDCLERDRDIAHFRELDELQLQHKLANLTFTSKVN